MVWVKNVQTYRNKYKSKSYSLYDCEIHAYKYTHFNGHCVQLEVNNVTKYRVCVPCVYHHYKFVFSLQVNNFLLLRGDFFFYVFLLLLPVLLLYVRSFIFSSFHSFFRLNIRFSVQFRVHFIITVSLLCGCVFNTKTKKKKQQHRNIVWLYLRLRDCIETFKVR